MYSENKNAFAPDDIALAISFIFSVPSGCFEMITAVITANATAIIPHITPIDKIVVFKILPPLYLFQLNITIKILNKSTICKEVYRNLSNKQHKSVKILSNNTDS